MAGPIIFRPDKASQLLITTQFCGYLALICLELVKKILTHYIGLDYCDYGSSCFRHFRSYLIGISNCICYGITSNPSRNCKKYFFGLFFPPNIRIGWISIECTLENYCKDFSNPIWTTPTWVRYFRKTLSNQIIFFPLFL